MDVELLAILQGEAADSGAGQEEAEILHRWETALRAAEASGRPVPICEHIPGQRSALVVIDMQRMFLDRGAAVENPAGRALIPTINRLARVVRKAQGVVVWIRQVQEAGDDELLELFTSRSYLGGDRVPPIEALAPDHPQSQLHPDLEIVPQDLQIEKHGYCAVLRSPLVDQLKSRGIDHVVVTGVATDVCAGHTAINLMQAGFRTVMVWDGTATLSRVDHAAWLARFFVLYGDVMTADEAARRLDGTPR